MEAWEVTSTVLVEEEVQTINFNVGDVETYLVSVGNGLSVISHGEPQINYTVPEMNNQTGETVPPLPIISPQNGTAPWPPGWDDNPTLPPDVPVKEIK